jgi:sensor histidine kinase YesM
MHKHHANPADQPAFGSLRWLSYELRVSVPLCVGIATVLTWIGGEGFWTNLVYSCCIGMLIQFSSEAGRYWMAARLARQNPQLPGLALRWPGWKWMAPWVLLCSGGGYWLGSLLADALTGHNHVASVMQGGNRFPLVLLLMSVVVAVTITYFFYSQGRIAATEAQAEAARRAAAENQLMLLQSQLAPHMLFNTLANLRVLIGLDAAQAQAMLDHLINFLRATLNASRSTAHPLSAEFDRVADYLALMRVRMGPRLQVQLDLPEALRALPVPPLLLQPLVENAILHGLEPKVEGGRIALSASLQGQWLSLSVRDTGVGLGQAPGSGGTGFGTHQVRERLATVFGGKAQFQIGAAADGDGGTLAVIQMPLANTESPT